MNHIPLGKKKLGEVSAVLPGRAGDESHFARRLSHHVTLLGHAPTGGMWRRHDGIQQPYQRAWQRAHRKGEPEAH